MSFAAPLCYASPMDWLVPLETFREALAREAATSAVGLRRGTMRIILLAPGSVQPQAPHDQDELYIVLQGAGIFDKAGDKRPVAEGDVLFVEAGVPHGFTDVTEGFEAYAVFWGPKGGEQVSY